MKAQSRGHSVDVLESNNFHFQIQFTFVSRSGSNAAGHACPVCRKDAFHSAHIALLVQNLGRKFYEQPTIGQPKAGVAIEWLRRQAQKLK